MITQITDTERKLKTAINLLTTTNEVLAERLAAAETAHARDLAAYQLTVENLTAERDAYAKAADGMCAAHKVERDADKTYIRQLEDAVTPEIVALRNERDALTDEVELKTLCIRGMRVEAEKLAQERDSMPERVRRWRLRYLTPPDESNV